MSSNPRQVFLILLFIAAVYFAAFIPANRTGARDAEMLSIFEVDEYAQYPHVVRMLTPGDSAYQSLRNFTVYLHYYYGYPFYLSSALSVLPLRLWWGAEWTAHSPWIITTLRQMISVLPMLAALLLLTHMQTRFRSWPRSVGLFALLLAVPGVVVNNLWWHVDSLMVLFIVLTLFFLQRDDFRYGRHFLFAAAACGLAVGTKLLGVFFVLAVPAYLLWGVARRKLTWGRAALMGAAFVGVMAAAVVIANPLLLLPQERAEILATQRSLFREASQGIFLTSTDTYFQWGQYPQDFRVHYGELAFVLLSLAGLGMGLRKAESRLGSAMILAWAVPMMVVFTVFATRRTHYFLPVMLPIISCLVHLLPEGWRPWQITSARWQWGLRTAALMLVVVQLGMYFNQDTRIYNQQLQREETSISLGFTARVEDWIAQERPNQELRVFRDWRVYLPETELRSVHMDWGLPNWDKVSALNPDLIALEQENITLYADPSAVQRAVDPGDMQWVHEFYRMAQEDRLPGYQRVLSDDFGVLFARSAVP